MLSSEDQDFAELPVDSFRESILAHLRQHQILICVGETGSGKTTKIPQIVMDAGMLDVDGNRLGIAVTQPRRVGAMTVAQRVAQERRVSLGVEVGYKVRFDDCSSAATRIVFITDGILVRECMQDPALKRYQVVMLDEAHERSIHTDILFGLLKAACGLRRDLKVLITSATLDTDKFVSYFNGCPCLHIPGRVYPVDLYHSKLAITMTASGPATNGYVQAAADTALQIHSTHSIDSGHILVFLTGQEEIERCCNMIREALNEGEASGRVAHAASSLLILPLHGSLPPGQQREVFLKPPVGVRKCIVCTNIAETSVTVPHVRYVVDAGYVKQKAYDPSRHLESLVVVPISQVAAQQRAGRAGRTTSGECYRLYSSESYRTMAVESVPEIRRCSMSSTVLTLKALGIQDVLGFDFIDPPSIGQMEEALYHLYLLGALVGEGSAVGTITPTGMRMSRLPLDPALSRMMVESSLPDIQCQFEMACVAAMISASAEDLFLQSQTRLGYSRNSGADDGRGLKRKHDEAVRNEERELAHARLRHPAGDHHTYLKILQLYDAECRRSSDDDAPRKWCRENYLRLRTLNMAVNIREQLLRDCAKILASDDDCKMKPRQTEISSMDALLTRCLLSGLFMNAARRCVSDDMYRTIPMFSDFDRTVKGNNSTKLSVVPLDEMKLVHLHPSSGLTKLNSSAIQASSGKQSRHPDMPLSALVSSEYIVFQDVLLSSKLFIRHASSVPVTLLHYVRDKIKNIDVRRLSYGAKSEEYSATAEDCLLNRSESPKDGNDEVVGKADISFSDISGMKGESKSKLDCARARYLARKQQR